MGATADSLKIIQTVVEEGSLAELAGAKRMEGQVRARLAQELAGIRIENGWYGMIQGDVDDLTMVAELKKVGVSVAPGRQFRLDNGMTNLIRVSLGGEPDLKRLRLALVALGRVLRGRVEPFRG